MHELLHEWFHNFIWDALLTEPEIQWVIQELLSVGAQIKADWDGALRTNTGRGDVQRKLADTNWHAVNTKIPQPKNARPCTVSALSHFAEQDKLTISNDRNASLVFTGPVPENLANLALVLDGDELHPHQTGKKRF
jgi:hypothetical protein